MHLSHVYEEEKYYETLMLEESGVIRLYDIKACKFHGIGTIRIKMFNNYELFFLCNVRYIPHL